ncbi:hypothetical protein LCM00_18620 [Bacillus infantis]|uniref:hypothetical protein n=1 Tax=Bacillus infantis TaxID=324767 RepID=UPI001CD4EF41|nr:hypothetical protein [Bacillus infantis]MCA1041535.1 hypothetical protein [Bacillus infantis]
MLKFLRKSRKNFYIVLFVTLAAWFSLYDYLTEKEVHLLSNCIQAAVYIAVYAFLDWGFSGKERKKE